MSNDLLDGCQILLDGESRRHPTADGDIPWVVLFASVLHEGQPAILARAHEWRVLFGGEAP